VSILLDRVVQTIVIIVRRRGREEHWGACTVLMHVGRAGSDSSRGGFDPSEGIFARKNGDCKF